MNRLLIKKLFLFFVIPAVMASVVTVFAAHAPAAAQGLTVYAPGVHVSIGVPVVVPPPRVVVAPPPPVVYVPPRRVYAPPPPVVVAPPVVMPPPVAVVPPPVYYQPRPVVVAPRPVVAPPMGGVPGVVVAPRPYVNKQARTNAIAAQQIRTANQINAMMIRNNLNALNAMNR
ncbi:hypothetical protein [Megalodesulfovibrio paquesii]